MRTSSTIDRGQPALVTAMIHRLHHTAVQLRRTRQMLGSSCRPAQDGQLALITRQPLESSRQAKFVWQTTRRGCVFQKQDSQGHARFGTGWHTCMAPHSPFGWQQYHVIAAGVALTALRPFLNCPPALCCDLTRGTALTHEQQRSAGRHAVTEQGYIIMAYLPLNSTANVGLVA